MGVNASRARSNIDVADAVVLRDPADGAETATATETAISLNRLDQAYWHDNEIPHGVMEVVVPVTALNLSTNTYRVELIVDDVAAMNNNPVVVATLNIVQTGAYHVYVDSKTLPLVDLDDDGTDMWMAARLTVGGTADSPSITYGAYITRSVAA